MQRSTDHILTTHTGSLPRPADLAEVLVAKDEGREYDPDALAQRVAAAVDEVIRRQVEIGLDVIDDGEMSKPSYVSYVKDRLTGFDGESIPRPGGADRLDFPGFEATTRGGLGGRRLPSCDGPIALEDADAVHHDLANFRTALGKAHATDAFVTAASPGQITRWLDNTYYRTHEEYLYALAEAMKPEYRAIVEAGYVLQLDCPDLASGRHSNFPDAPLEEFLKYAELHIEALNYALEGLPPDQIRMHLCWGNYAGPHHRDVELKDIIQVVFKGRPNGILFEGANPRHAHEWKLFEHVKLPEGKVLIPGVVESCSPYIEHPELVAQRIVQLARLVGRENVMVGSDCGFGTWVGGGGSLHPGIAWAKLESMVQGARLASAELW